MGLKMYLQVLAVRMMKKWGIKKHSLVWTSRFRLDKVLHSFNSNCWDDVRDFWINGMAFLGILDSHL